MHSIVCHCFLIIIGISSAYFYVYWLLKRSDTNITNINPKTETLFIRHINVKYQRKKYKKSDVLLSKYLAYPII